MNTASDRTGSSAAVLQLIANGHFSRGDPEVFRPLVDNLMHSDPFLVLADFAAYVACQDAIDAVLARSGSVEPHVHSQHRARGQILFGPRYLRILQRHLESAPGRHRHTVRLRAEYPAPHAGRRFTHHAAGSAHS